MKYNKETALKKTIPSLLLFVVVFIVSKLLFKFDIRTSLSAGWILGGIIWGWTLLDKWFSKFDWRYFFNTLNSSSPAKSAFAFIIILLRYIPAAAVGLVALPIGIVITIITLFGIGKDAYDKQNKINKQNTDNLNDSTSNGDTTQKTQESTDAQ
jgi:hypothetical protein